MATINDIYINALLADAAYVNGLVKQDLNVAEKLKDSMTQPQAIFIAESFTVASHIETTTGSGFDATVWKQGDGVRSFNITAFFGPVRAGDC